MSQQFYPQQNSNNPVVVLKEKSIIWNTDIDSPEFAERLDDEDRLSGFRDLFTFPKKTDLPHVDKSKLVHSNESCLYLCGQSLGLKPKSVNQNVEEVLNSWGSKGVHSHFNGFLPAALSDIPAKGPMARLVGAKESEIALMNGLTVNLHLLFATFYRPTPQRHKIIIEEHSFSSDMYVVKSQLTFHGYSPESSLVVLKPRPGEYLIREEDALKVIEDEGNSVCVILIPGIQYYTGQLFNVSKLTSAAHSMGIVVGVDLAHAAGNVPLYLHEWNVDFAAWCTYKYLNAGAGCIGAIFVHEKWTEKGGSSTFPMLKGWWGNQMKTKFHMKDEFDAAHGADMFKLSNPPAVLCAMLMASLDIFSQTSMEEINKKQFLLTGYLEYLLKQNFRGHNKSCFPTNSSSPVGNNSYVNGAGVGSSSTPSDELPRVEVITPSDPKQRGSQLSLCFSVPLQCVQEELQKMGIVCDIRMPHVMRVAPAPLYNSFCDVHKFVSCLMDVCKDLSGKFGSGIGTPAVIRSLRSSSSTGTHGLNNGSIISESSLMNGCNDDDEDDDDNHSMNDGQEMMSHANCQPSSPCISSSSMPSSPVTHASNDSSSLTSATDDSETDSLTGTNTL